MAGDGTSRINTEELLRAVQEITSIKNPLQRIQMRPMRSFANCRTLMQGRAQMIFTQWPVS